jgi:hypothetical protein
MDARVMGESGAMGFAVIVMPAENMTVHLGTYGKFRTTVPTRHGTTTATLDPRLRRTLLISGTKAPT